MSDRADMPALVADATCELDEKDSKIIKKARHGGRRPNTGGYRKGAGRPAGIPNKIHADVKAGILEAFERAGGPEYLLGIANSDPRTFCGLLGKVLPIQVAGDPNAPISLTISWGKPE